MKRETINNLLEDFLLKVEKKETSKQLAENLLLIIESEYERMKQNSNIALSRNIGLVEMLKGIDNVEILELLYYSKEILKHYIQTNRFDLISIPINQNSKDLSENIDFINKKLQAMLEHS